MEKCFCPSSGYCPRYKRHMIGHPYLFCSKPELFDNEAKQYLVRLMEKARSAPSTQKRQDGCVHFGLPIINADGSQALIDCPSCSGTVRLKAFQCNHLKHTANPVTTHKACKACEDFTAFGDEVRSDNPDCLDLSDLWPATSPPKKLGFCQGNGDSVNLEGLYRGRTAIFVGGGTSLRSVDLNSIQKNHIITLAVNNVAELMKPMLWVCADNPNKFPESIFDDPYVLKFAPRGWAGTKLADGKQVNDHPSMLFYRRNGFFRPNQFLSESTFNWGCLTGICDDSGWCGGRSVMLVALKILYHLGCSRVVLIGCDFTMTEEQAYAHSEKKDSRAVNSNNMNYQSLNDRFRSLKPIFDQSGFTVLNATKGSKLNAFEFVEFSDILPEIYQEV